MMSDVATDLNPVVFEPIQIYLIVLALNVQIF
jgi:hypothetical protein